MTREEAKKEFWKQNGVFEKGLATSYEKVIKSYFIGSEFDRFIDEIYDDFESRICENCEYHHNYHENTVSIDGCSDSYCNRIGINTPSYFGCNKFRRRENETK